MTTAAKMYKVRFSEKPSLTDFRAKVDTVRGRLLVVFSICAAVTCLFFFPIFSGNTFSDVSVRQSGLYPWAYNEVDHRTTLHYDQADTFYPWQVFINRALRSGEFPLWDPYSFAGHPFFANGQNGILYPPKFVLSFIFSPARVHDLLLILHMLASGVLMYLLLTDVSLSFSAALFGAIAWMLNSFMLSWMALEHFVVIQAGLPLVTLLLRRAILRSSWPSSVGSGIVLTLIYLGGNLLFVEIVLAASGAWVAYLLFNRGWERLRGRADRIPAGQMLREVSIGVVPFIICLGFIAVQLLPNIELIQSMDRTPLSYDWLTKARLDPASLIYFFIRPPLEIATSEGVGIDPYHRLLFSGTPTALLALIGIWNRQRLAAFSRWVAVLTLLVALGSPVTWIVYNVLPGFGHLKPLGRVLFMFNFAATVLAAFGLEMVLGFTPRLARPQMLEKIKNACVFVAIIIVVGQMYRFAVQVNHYQPNNREYLYPETPLIRALKGDSAARILPIFPSFYGSTAMTHNLYNIGGYESLLPNRTSRLLRVIGGDTLLQAISIRPSIAFPTQFNLNRLRMDLLARLGITHIVASPYASLYNSDGWNLNSARVLDFAYGQPGKNWIPLMGDWNHDGIDTVGLYDPVSSEFHLKNINSSGPDDLTFSFGPAGKGLIPIAGDWDGDGVDTVGLYEPETGTFFLRNSNTSGAADLTIKYESAKSGWIPLAGDWDGDGVDTVGLFDPVRSEFHLRNSNTSGSDDVKFRYGNGGSGWIPLVGDWNVDGVDTVGLYEPERGAFWLRDWNTEGFANNVVKYGLVDDKMRPIVGRIRRDSAFLGLYDSTAGTFHFKLPRVGDVLAANRVYHGSDGNIYVVPGALPQAYFVSNCERVNSSLAALQRFTEASFNPSQAVIVEESYIRQIPALHNASESNIATAPTADVQITDRHLNSLSLQVSSAGDGWLVINESWDSGWKATVDGLTVPVIPGNYAFRTLPVTAGKHTVKMRYEPAAFRIGLAITLGTFVVVLVLGVAWVLKSLMKRN